MAVTKSKRRKNPHTKSRPQGRPAMQVDKKAFEMLCGLQCTCQEMAGALGVSERKLRYWCKEEYHKPFNEVFEEKASVGKVSLRRKQWRLADTSSQMAIFLGKNYLNQKDTQDMSIKMTADETAKAMGDYFEQRKQRDKQ